MVLALLERFAGESFGPVVHRIVWGAVLPQDLSRQVTAEQMLVQTGIHSRRRAMDELGVRDPDLEFERWLEERKTILQMNRELNAKFSRGGERGRAVTSPGEPGEEE